MDFLISIFHTILYQPLFNALIYLYGTVAFHDLGIAIIELTVIIRFFLYPLSKKAIVSQKALSVLQPKIKEIQRKYKDKEEQAKQLMALYKKYKVNPLAGCLPILIQLPILIALFRVFLTGLDTSKFNILYSFVPQPETLDTTFIGILDLGVKSIPLALLAGALQFVYSKMMMPQTNRSSNKSGGVDMASVMSKQMVYIMPIITAVIALQMPAALPLYWSVLTLFGIIQQKFTSIQVNGEIEVITRKK